MKFAPLFSRRGGTRRAGDAAFLPGGATVVLTTVNKGAVYTLDARVVTIDAVDPAIGLPSVTLSGVPAGNHTLQVTRPDAVTYVAQFAVTDGGTTRVDVPALALVPTYPVDARGRHDVLAIVGTVGVAGVAWWLWKSRGE